MVRPLVSSKVNEIHHFLRQGKSCSEISLLLNVSKSSVGRIRKSLPNLPLPSRGGRKKILSETTERRILRDLRQQKVENAVQIQKQLAENENIHVSVETVRNTLRAAGLKGRAKVKKPMLTKRHQQIRLDFAKKYASWTAEDWEKVIWSDETKVNRLGSDGKEWCWRKSGQTLQAKDVRPTLKFGGGSVMVWGCMTAKGVGTVHRIVGTMTAQSYVNILSTNLPTTAEKLGLQKEDIVFQQDNDPKHTAKLTKKWLSDNRYNVLDWPPQSPDLNPIEHLWGVLKRGVVGTPGNLEELWAHVRAAWDDIDANICKNLVDSMPRRIDAVIKAKGGYTKY